LGGLSYRLTPAPKVAPPVGWTLTKRLSHAEVMNNMKTMVGIATKDAPTSAGAPDELRLLNRFYPSLFLGCEIGGLNGIGSVQLRHFIFMSRP
jgi:hypothetical protein